ncbi:MAG: hypothetical protein U0599_15225 [Vicinamibacteria bacterium]
MLRSFEVTPLDGPRSSPALKEKLPRRAVAAVAAWSVALAIEALRAPGGGRLRADPSPPRSVARQWSRATAA